jgi:ABC-type Fe3+/spermidine/putrescine transport system ATPase subunit
MPVTVDALRVEGLAKSYGASPVLDSVSIVVGQGRCTAVLGPSGCGKSTLLRIVAGLVGADAGRVEIAGAVTDDPRPRVPPERRGVGFVFQDLALWPHMSVRGNLAFVLQARGVRGAQAETETLEAVESVGLPATLLHRRPGELSGGERQRAAIARVLVQRPALVLLDEPLTNLDRGLRVQILALLRRLRSERGLATLLVTHDRDEAFALADRVAVLRRGRVEQEGPPEEVYGSPTSTYVARLVGTASFVPARREGGAMVTALGSWPADGAPNGPLVAVFRPETIRFAVEGATRGRCLDAFYRGDHWLHAVEVEDSSARPTVLVRGSRPARPGEAVRLEADRPSFVRETQGEEA